MFRHNIVAVLYILVAIIIAQILIPETYDWVTNSISQLGAQDYDQAWIMQAGFIGFGLILAFGIVKRLIKKQASWQSDVPLLIYTIAIIFTGVFQAKPFSASDDYSIQEAKIHSGFAISAGLALSLSMFVYIFISKSQIEKVWHWIFMFLIMIFSMLFFMVKEYDGVIQRILMLIGFIWLVFLYNKQKSDRITKY